MARRALVIAIGVNSVMKEDEAAELSPNMGTGGKLTRGRSRRTKSRA